MAYPPLLPRERNCSWLTTFLASIQKLLNLNHDPRPTDDLAHDSSGQGGLVSHSTPILNEDGDPIWKVLVFDGMGRDVISSVLRVNDLRAWGITIHLYDPKLLTPSTPSTCSEALITNDRLLPETSIRNDIPSPMSPLSTWWNQMLPILKRSRTISPMAYTLLLT